MDPCCGGRVVRLWSPRRTAGFRRRVSIWVAPKSARTEPQHHSLLIFFALAFALSWAVVERTSGQPYGQYVQQRIFAPLGMEHSYVSVEQDRLDGLADGHRFWFGVPVSSGPTVRPGLLAAGYLISSVSDLGCYLSLYLNDGETPDGVRIVSEDALRTMLSPGPETTLGPWADGAPARYAMGWFVGGPGMSQLCCTRATRRTRARWSFCCRGGVGPSPGVTNATDELPLAPSVIDRLSRNGVDIVLGEDPAAGGSLRQFYVIFDIAAVLLLAGAGWDVGRAVRRLRRGTGPSHRWLAWGGIGARLVVDAFLLRLPAATSYGWAAAWVWLPDLTLTVALLASLLTATALLLPIATRRAKPDATGRPDG